MTTKTKRKPKQIKSFTIDRKIWLRRDNLSSCLLREADNKLCCLGILGRKCGVPDNEMVGLGEPSDVSDEWQDRFPSWLLGSTAADRKEVYKFISINDNVRTTDASREKALTEAFAKHNIKVRFKN